VRGTRAGTGFATLLLSLLTAACVPASAPAQSPPGWADFEALAPGTKVTNQYANADQYGGAEFGTTPDGQSGPAPVVAARTEAEAGTGTHTAELPPNCRALPKARPRKADVVCEPTPFWVHFPTSRRSYNASFGSPRGGAVSVAVTAYALDGANGLRELSTNGRDIAAGAPVEGIVNFYSAADDIAFLKITATKGDFQGLEMDDLSWQVPDTPPPPDFGMVLFDPNQLLRPALVPGDSISLKLVIRRANRSTGPIDLRAEGLPRGVTASFSPPQSDGPDGATVDVTVHADSTAKSSEAPFTVVGTPAVATAGAAERRVQLPLKVVERFDLRTNGLEVFQAVQRDGLFAPSGNNRDGNYNGEPLVRGGKTVARFYVDSEGGNPGEASAVLRGYDAGGRPLPGSPLMAEYGTVLTNNVFPFVLDGVRGEARPFTFTLPHSWTDRDRIGRLEAEVRPPAYSFIDDPRVECSTAACRQNNVTKLHDVDFVRTRAVEVYPVAVLDDHTSRWTDGPSDRVPPPIDVFAKAIAAAPVAEGDFHLHGYRDVIDATQVSQQDLDEGERTKAEQRALGQNLDDPVVFKRLQDEGKIHGNDLNGQLTRLVADWDNAHGHPGNAVVGVHSGISLSQYRGDHRVSHVQTQRPLTAVAHELFHSFGRPHADRSDKDGGCNGGGDGEGYFDPRGHLFGIGLDRSQDFPYRTIVQGAEIAPTLPTRDKNTLGEVYDFMSYCIGGNETASWISPHNWEKTIDYLQGRGLRAGGGGGAPASVAAAPAGRILHVEARLESSGVAAVDSVRHVSRAVTTPGAVATDTHLVGRDAAGNVLGDVAMTGLVSDNHPTPAFLELAGELPAANLARVDVVRAGSVIATRSRSANAPTVRLTAPRQGAVVGRGAQVTVSWRSADAEGDARTAEVDYSGNGGRTWANVYAGGDAGRARVPSRLLFGSRAARVRVRLGDGFNETEAISGVFRARGAPPVVGILSPLGGATLRADATLSMTGSGEDDRGRFLAGGSLRWFLGARRIGTGRTASASGLPAGVRRLRLVARDSTGRTAATSVRVRVLAVRPLPLRLVVPRSLSRRARALTLRIAPTIPSRLTGAGVNRQLAARVLRSVRIAVTPGRRALVVRLRLRAGRLSTPLRIVVPRR
jgi:hypothetical protein